jgi:hypothetical protein
MRSRDRHTPALVISVLALFIALGGSAWALKTNSVRSRTIVNGQVKTSDLDDGAVTSSKVAAAHLHKVSDPPSGGDACAGTDPDTGVFCGSTAQTPSGAVWSNYPFPGLWEGASFFKDAAGVVHLQGLVQCSPAVECSSQPVIFVLPPSYRPAQGLVYGVDSGLAAHNRVEVHPNGVVRWYVDDPSSPHDYLSLSGVSFR